MGMEKAMRHLRGVVAVCLCWLFSVSSLSVLAAQTFNAGSDTDCCRTKCCCRKHAGHSGPAVSQQSCARDCAGVTLGKVAGIGFHPPTLQGWPETPVVLALVSEVVHSRTNAITFLKLLQRPPPLAA